MKALFSSLLVFGAVSAVLAQTEPQPAPQPSMSQLKHFHGHWKGDLTMGAAKFAVDMTWKQDTAGKWNIVEYTYTQGKTVLDYRVLISKEPTDYTLSLWMIGAEYTKPLPMKAELNGGTLTVLSEAPTMPSVSFSIEGGDLIMRITTVQEGVEKEIGKGILKKV